MIISSLLLSFKSEESSEIVKHWNYMKMAHIKLFSESRIIFMINCSSYHSHHRFVGMHALNLYEEIHHFPILNRQNLCSRYPMNEAFFYTWDLTHRKKWHTFAPMRIKQEGKHTHTHTPPQSVFQHFFYIVFWNIGLTQKNNHHLPSFFSSHFPPLVFGLLWGRESTLFVSKWQGEALPSRWLKSSNLTTSTMY